MAGAIVTCAPELAKHLRQIADSNRLDRGWMADERFDEIMSLCDIAASHLTSAREAAFRRDQTLLKTHLGHAVESVKLTVNLHNLLPVANARGRT